MSLTLDNLPSKFHPYLLGHPSCPSKIKPEIDDVIKTRVVKLKDNIFDAGKWILKLPRTVGLTTPDSHIYRIRKAEKVRRYIVDNQLDRQLMVPSKFLYWHEGRRKFYVVSEKVELSNEVAKPASEEIENAVKGVAPTLHGQAEALTNGNPKRDLTPVQAKALAELSTLGYTDLTYNNLYFTPSGRVAIIDTEPVKRWFKKPLAESKIFWLFGDRGYILAQHAIIGMAKLKSYCNPEAKREVEKVERNHALWNIAKLVFKIALVSLALYFIPSALASLLMGGALATVLKVSLIAFCAIKIVNLVSSVASIAFIWTLSRNSFLAPIGQIEKMGLI